MIFYVHPDNLAEIEKEIKLDKRFDRFSYGIKILTNQFIDKYRETGKYVLPSGKAVKKDDVVVQDGRFFEWGSSDLEIKLLLEWGMIKKEKEMNIIMIDEEQFSYSKIFEFPPLVVPALWLETLNPTYRRDMILSSTCF